MGDVAAASKRKAVVLDEEEEEERYRSEGVSDVEESDGQRRPVRPRPIRPRQRAAQAAKKRKSIFSSSEDEEEDRYREEGIDEVVEVDEAGNEKSRRPVSPRPVQRRGSKQSGGGPSRSSQRNGDKEGLTDEALLGIVSY